MAVLEINDWDDSVTSSILFCAERRERQRRSSSGPKGEVRLVRLAELAVADSPKSQRESLYVGYRDVRC
eukprot:scaffold128496_cov24-Phaeocystis_antarctica.AAC.1